MQNLICINGIVQWLIVLILLRRFRYNVHQPVEFVLSHLNIQYFDIIHLYRKQHSSCTYI